MELRIQIMIFKESEPSLDGQYLVISTYDKKILHKDIVPIPSESR